MSCGNNENKVESVKASAEQKAVAEDKLTLNNENKWKVNAETHQGMTQIKVILENMDPLTLEDYVLMGDKCDEQTSFIISNCSMTGEAHNQLHHVLHPILNDISALQNSVNLEDASAAMMSLEDNLHDYFTHFEI